MLEVEWSRHCQEDALPTADLKVTQHQDTVPVYLWCLLQGMLDSVGIRLPSHKVRQITTSLKDSGDISGETISKLKFLEVSQSTP